MDTRTILLVTGLIVGLATAGIVSTVGFSTPVHGQATVSNCRANGPAKACGAFITAPSNNPAGPNTNAGGQSHTGGPSAQLGGSASVIPKTCPQSVGNECFGGVFTPSGNENLHGHNATSP